MGFSIAQQFVNEGGKVMITGRSTETVNKAVEKLGTNAFGMVSNSGKMRDIFSRPALNSILENQLPG